VGYEYTNFGVSAGVSAFVEVQIGSGGGAQVIVGGQDCTMTPN
jgi:hypothetical protein